ncbi:MAG: HdeD family acid-resistance protein [Polyangia bacterium]
MSLDPEINRGVKWSIALSVLMIAAGVLAIISPHASGIAVTILVGWLLVLGGGAHLAYSWHARDGGGLIWGIVLGILYIIAGAYLLAHPVAGLASLTFALAAFLFIGATVEIILSTHLRLSSGSGWLLVDGIITVVLAIMMWRTWPKSSPWLLGTLVGINMIFSGIARLAISLAVRRVTNAGGPESSVPEPG